MDQRLIKFLGAGPYPSSIETLDETLDFAYCDEVMIGINKKALTLPVLNHCHQSYEFFIPIYPTFRAQIGNRKLIAERNKLFPLNSEQSHGASSEVSGCNILGVQIDKGFLQETSRLIFGQPEVYFYNESMKVSHDIQWLIGLFREEYANRQAGYEFVMQSLSSHIAVKILRQARSNMPLPVRERKYAEKENIKRAIDFITEHYNTDFSLDDLTKVVNLSSYHFIKVFKDHTGKTPYEYLLDIKIGKAREMLKKTHGNLTLTQICYLSGFNNLSHFSASFKRKTGVPPSVYRKK